jgi:hypothetical protein
MLRRIPFALASTLVQLEAGEGMMTEDNRQALADEIADMLGEKMASAKRQINAIVELFGEDGARALLEETLQIEQNGGMMILSGERRRTPGGVFFFIAMERARPEDRPKIRQHEWKKLQKQKGKKRRPQPLSEEVRLGAVNELLQEVGEVSSVKIVVIGRPGKIKSFKDMVMTTMTNTNTPTNLPKGLPAPPKAATTYVVYIGNRQWRKVEQSIANPEDALIIEGYCTIDPEVQGISVYATSVTTKLIERQKRETQRAQAMGTTPDGEGNEAQNAAPAEESPAAPTMSQAEAAQILAQLYRDEDSARATLDEIKSLPPNEQVGLGEALRELQRIKNEIKAIKQQFPGL